MLTSGSGSEGCEAESEAFGTIQLQHSGNQAQLVHVPHCNALTSLVRRKVLYKIAIIDDHNCAGLNEKILDYIQYKLFSYLSKV